MHESRTPNYGDFNATATAFTQGLRELPTDYVTRVRNFLAEYLGTSRRPIPFGGRTKEFAYLDSWLTDPQAPPYLLMAAPAGRGKSALLLRWCLQLFSRSELALTYFPVSIRFRTNLAGVVFPSLVALLAPLHDEKVPTDPNLNEEVWRSLLFDYLSRPLPDGRTLLLILDGIDEAADWSASGLFPPNPSSGLRVILSARSLANDQGVDAWLQRLNWTRPHLALTLELSPLDRSGIAHVLNQMGFPLDLLSTRVNLISELYRLSEGDPLLVRLYIDDLWARGESVVRLQPDDLRALRPGLNGYFERWWQDQRLLWNTESPQRESIAQTVLSLLAAALGPLSQQDILSLVPPEIAFQQEQLDMTPLARFVTGDGIHQGYVFSHPRLANYFFEERLDETARQEIEQRFLTWGAQTLASLHEGRLSPEQVSPYCIHYYGAHLERAQANASTLLALVSQPWLRAWEKLDRANAGFLSDVQRAWRALERENLAAIALQSPIPYLGEELRCLLCQTSVNSVTSNISPRLMLEAVKTRVWTPAQGLACLRLISDLAPRARELVGLAPFVQEPLRTDILQEALDTASAIKDDYARLDILVELAPSLPETLLWQILEIAPTIEDEADRASFLSELAPSLSSYQPLADRTLEYLQAMEDEESRALALVGLTPSFAPTYVEQLWHLSETLSDERYHTQALTALLPFLSEPLLQATWHLTRTIQDGLSRIRLLADLVGFLPAHLHPDALQETLNLLQEIEDRQYRLEVLVKLAPLLSDEMFQQALHELQLFWDENYRTTALLHLLPCLPETLVPQFQEAVLAIRSDELRTRVLIPLLPRLSTTQLDQALKRVQTTWDEGCRAELLAQLILCAPESLLSPLLEIVSTIQDQGYRVWLLAELEIPMKGKLHASQFNIATVFTTLKGRDDRLQTLLAIAPRLSDLALTRIFSFMLPELFDFTWRIQSEEQHAHILSKLASRLPEDWLSRAMKKIHAMNDEFFQVQSLVSLAPRIHDTWLTEALDIVRNMKDRERRAQVLEVLVSSLPEEQKAERVLDMLQVLQVIKDETDRAQLVSTCAPSLSSKLSPAHTHVILQAVHDMLNEQNKVHVLTNLIPYLPKDALEEALYIVQTLHSEQDEAQAQFLVAAVPHLPQHLFFTFLDQVQALQHPRWRTYVLAASLPYAPMEYIHALLDEAQSLQDEHTRTEMFITLAPYVPQEIFSQLLPLLQAFPDEILYIRVLTVLPQHLPEDSLPQLWETVQAISNYVWQVWVLRAFVPHLSENLFSQVLETSLAIKDTEKRARFLFVLAPHIPTQNYLQFWKGIQTLPERSRWQILEVLSPRVPAHFFSSFFMAVQAVPHTWTQLQILEALLPHVPDDSFFQVWDIVQSLEPQKVPMTLLAKLATYAPLRFSLPIWQRIHTTGSISIHLDFLKRALPYIAQEYPATILEILDALPSGPTLLEILTTLVPSLSQETALTLCTALLPLQPGTSLADNIPHLLLQKDKDQLHILATLAPSLPEEVSTIIASSLIKTFPQWKSEEDRALLLTRLAPLVPSTLIPEMLETTCSLTLSDLRLQVLPAFLSALSPEDWQTVLTWLMKKNQQTEDIRFSTQLLSLYDPSLHHLPVELFYRLIHQILQYVAKNTRRDALLALASFSPALLALGGEATVSELCSATLEVGCWWP